MKLIINGKAICAKPGTPLLKICRKEGIIIPTLCHLPRRRNPHSVCRICSVRIKGRRGLAPACSTVAEDGMEIETCSEEVLFARRVLMQFILAEHGPCRNPGCEIERLAFDLGVLEGQAPSAVVPPVREETSDYLRINKDLCIHCRKCIESCDWRVIEGERGPNIEFIYRNEDPDSFCTHCGNCAAICPSGAIRSI